MLVEDEKEDIPVKKRRKSQLNEGSPADVLLQKITTKKTHRVYIRS